MPLTDQLVAFSEIRGLPPSASRIVGFPADRFRILAAATDEQLVRLSEEVLDSIRIGCSFPQRPGKRLRKAAPENPARPSAATKSKETADFPSPACGRNQKG